VNANHLHKYFGNVRRVLIEMYAKSMALYGLDYADLNIASVGNVQNL
jgi:hypothetical protein